MLSVEKSSEVVEVVKKSGRKQRRNAQHKIRLDPEALGYFGEFAKFRDVETAFSLAPGTLTREQVLIAWDTECEGYADVFVLFKGDDGKLLQVEATYSDEGPKQRVKQLKKEWKPRNCSWDTLFCTVLSATRLPLFLEKESGFAEVDF